MITYLDRSTYEWCDVANIRPGDLVMSTDPRPRRVRTHDGALVTAVCADKLGNVTLVLCLRRTSIAPEYRPGTQLPIRRAVQPVDADLNMRDANLTGAEPAAILDMNRPTSTDGSNT